MATFRVTVDNQLQQPIWVKVTADRQFLKQFYSSSYQHQNDNAYNKASTSHTDANQRYSKSNRESSDYGNNKAAAYNESAWSQSSGHHSSGSGGGGISVFGVGANAYGSKSKSGSSSSSQYRSNDSLKHNISQQQRKAMNEDASSVYASGSNLYEDLSQKMSTLSMASSGVFINKVVDAGLMRIAQLQRLEIPVPVDKQSHVVYITIVCQELGEPLVNSTQLDKQLVVIRRNFKTKAIEYSPETPKTGHYGSQVPEFRRLLQELKIPAHIADNMEKEGWDDVETWHELISDEAELKGLGFKGGHKAKFKKHVQNKDHIFAAPSFKIDPDKVRFNGFEVIFDKVRESETYIVQTKESENKESEWVDRATTSGAQARRLWVAGLKKDRWYFVRVCAVNPRFSKQRACSEEVQQIKTKQHRIAENAFKFNHEPKSRIVSLPGAQRATVYVDDIDGYDPDGFPSVTFGPAVPCQQYQIYRIRFVISIKSSFMFGFGSKKSDLKDVDRWIGCGDNASMTTAIYTDDRNRFCLYDKDHPDGANVEILDSSWEGWNPGYDKGGAKDFEFVMEFDFQRNALMVYWGLGSKLLQIDGLPKDSVVPMFSFCRPNWFYEDHDTIRIVDWKLY